MIICYKVVSLDFILLLFLFKCGKGISAIIYQVSLIFRPRFGNTELNIFANLDGKIYKLMGTVAVFYQSVQINIQGLGSFKQFCI